MGVCQDCKYYDTIGYFNEDSFSADNGSTYGCTLTDDPQDPYDSCDSFESKYYDDDYDDDDDGDGKDNLFEIFIDPVGSIENFMGLE